MSSHPPSGKEHARLDALRRYNILDTAPEAQFEDLTSLVAHVCQVPIATLTLLDERRQWFKSKRGITIAETPRERSFCTHTIEHTNAFIIPDTLADPRFAHNLLVTDPPHVRFYVGVSLVTADGHAIGTLCAIDRVPRVLDEAQLDALHALARQAMALIEQRRTMRELAEALERVRSLEGLLPICAYCHQIRDEDGVWHKLERYISERSDVEFSHGMCQVCYARHFPEDFDPRR